MVIVLLLLRCAICSSTHEYQPQYYIMLFLFSPILRFHAAAIFNHKFLQNMHYIFKLDIVIVPVSMVMHAMR